VDWIGGKKGYLGRNFFWNFLIIGPLIGTKKVYSIKGSIGLDLIIPKGFSGLFPFIILVRKKAYGLFIGLWNLAKYPLTPRGKEGHGILSILILWRCEDLVIEEIIPSLDLLCRVMVNRYTQKMIFPWGNRVSACISENDKDFRNGLKNLTCGTQDGFWHQKICVLTLFGKKLGLFGNCLKFAEFGNFSVFLTVNFGGRWGILGFFRRGYPWLPELAAFFVRSRAVKNVGGFFSWEVFFFLFLAPLGGLPHILVKGDSGFFGHMGRGGAIFPHSVELRKFTMGGCEK